MSEKSFRVEIPVSFKRRPSKPAQQATPDTESDAAPRIASLLALAHKWEEMVRRGDVKGYAEIARSSGLSNARITQITQLVLLPPAIQEALILEQQEEQYHTRRRCGSHPAIWPNGT